MTNYHEKHVNPAISRLRNIIALFSFILILVSCSRDAPFPNENLELPVVEELYFSFKANKDTSESDNWVIIHNENGELLDYKSFEENDYLEFKTKSPLLTDKISISLFSYSEINGNIYHTIATTTGIDKGSVWDDENETITVGATNTLVGDFSFTLIDFPEIKLFNISNENGGIGGGLSGSGSGGVWTYSASNYSLYEKNNYLFTIVESNADSKYFYLQDIQNEDNILINYSEFKLFDSYLNIDLPLNSSYVMVLFGFEDYQDYFDGDGYKLSQIFPFNNYDVNQNPLRIGYLNRFNKYMTQFNVYFENYIYNYKKYGSKPNEIIVPENLTFSISDNSVRNFEFSTNITFVKYVSKWSYSIGIRNTDWIGSFWRVESSTNMYPKIGNLPDELFQLYQDLDVNSLEYSQTIFTLNPEENIIFN